MEDVVRLQDGFYILSTSSRVDDRTCVLKQGDTFAIFDRFGDIEEIGTGALGLYHRDTRFLSKLALRLAGERPLLLSSTIKEDNAVLAVDLMNPDIPHAAEVVIPRGSVHVFRSKVMWGPACHERLRVSNYGLTAVVIELTIDFAADYCDIFEVRGAHRERRGKKLDTELIADAALLAYEGLDGCVRGTQFVFDPKPTELTPSQARYELRLGPRGEATCHVEVTCEEGLPSDAATRRKHLSRTARSASCYENAALASADALGHARAETPAIVTSNTAFNEWLTRGASDLYMMETKTPHGRYPFAGVPWFSTEFGRDGIIVGLEYLWFKPDVARGVLRFLAATQADRVSEEQDAQPGKILHEMRGGEMAKLGEVPFGRYYGSVDATPLFLMLAGAYYERSADLPLIREIWPNIERAIEWIDRYGDSNGDGFVDYARQSKHGLVQQGWKDSYDSVFHRDAALAEPPIALCEVQGYVYAGKTAASTLARALDMPERADKLAGEADALRERFERAFWCDDIGTYALALDGSGRPCRVVASNAGHCLFTGIASDERARNVAQTLLDRTSFSGWGIRTVANTEARYNPMSYHNGSVWPHDNAIVAAGFARYGLRREAVRVMSGLFDATRWFDLHRPPELFCGFPRRDGESPTLYPVSCSPQTWASGAVFLLLTACLGLAIDGPRKIASFQSPMLPQAVSDLQISGLTIGDAKIDLAFARHGDDVGVNVLRREGSCSVVVHK
ncbi:MAG TPA: amylo-alpha-1,6-glucosidase [Casimicrobiaceae bacterium]|nr:amylo-alpha-1,6-glucosidase [Casimicrobiaceae bacterium]